MFRGDIYAENGWFNGTVRASRIEGDIGDVLPVISFRWGRIYGESGFLENRGSVDIHLCNVRRDHEMSRRVAFVGQVAVRLANNLNQYCRGSLLRNGEEIWADDVTANFGEVTSGADFKTISITGLSGDIPAGDGAYEFVLRLTNPGSANWTSASITAQLTGVTLRAGTVFF